jgi:hypothetical protein
MAGGVVDAMVVFFLSVAPKHLVLHISEDYMLPWSANPLHILDGMG